MNASEIATVREWLKANRGKQTQEDLAAAITAATGWNITRDRYSKYESGPLSIGAQVLAHFVAYWRSNGKPGPDFTPRLVPEDPMERIALALERIGDKLDLLRTDMAGQSGAVVGEVRTLAERLTESLAGMRDAS